MSHTLSVHLMKRHRCCHSLLIERRLSEVARVLFIQHFELLPLLKVQSLLVEQIFLSALLLVELVHLFRQFGNRVLHLDDLEALIEGMIYNVSRLDKLGLVHCNAVVDRLEQQELASI